MTGPLPTSGTMHGKSKVGVLLGVGGLFTAMICIAGLCIGIAVFTGGSSASSEPICTTPTAAVGVAPTPGPAATPACFVPRGDPVRADSLCSRAAAVGAVQAAAAGGNKFHREERKELEEQDVVLRSLQ